MRNDIKVKEVQIVILLTSLITGVSSKDIISFSYPQVPVVSGSYGAVSSTGELQVIDIDSITCQTNLDCLDALPHLDVALGIGSKFAAPPKCSISVKATAPLNASGFCTCGPGKCVSFSMEFGKDTPFYYCGPCSHIGAQCQNGTCSHAMSECKADYCQCIKDGDFYEFNYCQIPYIAYESSLQACIILCIIIVGLLIISSIYSTCKEHPRWHRRHTIESEFHTSRSDDLPPDYEEVMDNLPTYDDALQMAEDEGLPEEGVTRGDLNSDTNGNLTSERHNGRDSTTPSSPRTQRGEEEEEEEEKEENEMTETQLTGILKEASDEDRIGMNSKNTDDGSITETQFEEQRIRGPAILRNRSNSLPNVHKSSHRLSGQVILQPIELVLHQLSNSQTHC